MSRASPYLVLCALTVLLLTASPLLTGVAWSFDHAKSSDMVMVQEGGSTADQGDPDELDTTARAEILLKTPPTTTGGETPIMQGASSVLGWSSELSILVQLLSVIP